MLGNNHEMGEGIGGRDGRGALEQMPRELLAALPTDPFEQLDVARRIAAVAHEAHARALQEKLGGSQEVVNTLQARVGQLEAALKEATNKLAASQEEQVKLTSDKNALVATVKKLNRDVAKLEAFKRTLMMQLQDEPDDDAAAHAAAAAARPPPPEPPEDDVLSDASGSASERGAGPSEGAPVLPAKPSKLHAPAVTPPTAAGAEGENKATYGGAYVVEDDGASAMAASVGAPSSAAAAAGRIQHARVVATNMPRSSGTIRIVDSAAQSSQFSDPVAAPAAAPAPAAMATGPIVYSRASAAASGASFGRSFSSNNDRSADDDMEGTGSSLSTSRPQRTPLRTPSLTPQFSPHITPSHTPPTGSASGSPRRGRPRVDGKEFFRQARNRLSYEQFSLFLANIKELNAHRQTREETLKKADEIFGAENKDLYTSFDGLLSRHLPS